MKNSFLLSFLLFFLPQLKANTVIYSCNSATNLSSILFLNYLTGDTLYFSDKSSACFSVEEMRYKEAIVLIINNNQRDKKRITIDSDTIKFEISGNTNEEGFLLKFTNRSFNQAYYQYYDTVNPKSKRVKQLMREGLSSTLSPTQKDSVFKELDTIRTSINKLWLDFFVAHPQSYLALDLLNSFLQMNEFDKNTLKKLWVELDSNFSIYPQWDYCKTVLENKSKVLVEGDLLPETNLYNAENNLVRLNSIVAEKNTYIVFWASWCRGCLEEISEVKRSKTIVDSLKLNIVFICVDDKYNSKNRDKFEANESALYTNTGFNNDLVMRSGLTQLPYGMLVDKSGKLKERGVDLSSAMKYKF